MKSSWKYEIARDAMAFGSILFYFIVIIRAIIGKYMPFVYQLLIAWAVLVLISLVIKNANHHIARAFVLLVFVSLFYNENLFTFFAILLWLFMLGAAFYMKEKKEAIIKGIIIGVFAAVVGYYLGQYLPNF
jgi:hypothetical protein